MPEELAWIEGLPAAVTVTDAEGVIVAMNEAARRAYASFGGGELVGSNVLDCHPEPSRTAVREQLAHHAPNQYTTSKAGKKRIIHQLPWFRAGVFAGLVEIAIPIPEEMPHFSRDG